MGKYEHVEIEARERIGWLRLNRPGVMNAGTGKTWDEMANALRAYERDDAIRKKGARSFVEKRPSKFRGQ